MESVPFSLFDIVFPSWENKRRAIEEAAAAAAVVAQETQKQQEKEGVVLDDDEKLFQGKLLSQFFSTPKLRISFFARVSQPSVVLLYRVYRTTRI